LFSKNIAGSFRNASQKLGNQNVTFEGGKSLDINESVANAGVAGAKRFLSHLNMLESRHILEHSQDKTIYIEKSSWIRAKYSGYYITTL
jgi:predicted deacylase